MDKMDKPRGLVRYASEASIADGKPFVVTPRLKAYIVVLLVLFVGWLAILITRSTVDMEVRKVAGLLYQERDNGDVTNLYNVMFLNKSHHDFKKLHVRVLGAKAHLEWVGLKDSVIVLPKEGMLRLTGYIVMKQSAVTERQQKLKLELYDGTRLLHSEKTVFLAPIAR
jgi:polyferredoxin